MKHIFTFLLLILVIPLGLAQKTETILLDYWQKNYLEHGVTKADVTELYVANHSYLEDKKATVYYVNQLHNGITIENAIASMIVKNGKVFSVTHSFQKNIKSKVKNTDHTSLQNALPKVLTLKKYASTINYKTDQITPNTFKISIKGYENYTAYADLQFYKQKDKTLKLVWNFELYDAQLKHLYQVKLDAKNHELLVDKNLNLQCTHLEHQTSFYPFTSKKQNKALVHTQNDANQYLVYNFNSSGPLDGERILETNPHDTTASPWGWHDINGQNGADFTNTKGNNVFAYEDVNNENTEGQKAEGGTNLNFVFPYSNPDQSPSEYLNASITNLFYINNKIHDLLYHFGFDELSGNFQQNQYNKMAGADLSTPDPVMAEAQDGSGFNNANISVPRDGSSPRMQMYLWKSNPNELLKITSPTDIAGFYVGIDNVFEPGHVAPPHYPNPLVGNVILVDTPNNDGCTTIANAQELSGNIALIKRGNCSFTEKAIQAQNAGAIAVIVMNNEPDSLVNMSGADANIQIPVLFISKENGDLWIEKLTEEIPIILEIGQNINTTVYDGSFDNSIIVHEYIHGLSIRLTGGRNTATCLTSAEQMGEGWSDYLALLLQIKATDNGSEPKGIGSFAMGANDTSATIREYPYSTDLAINPLTYGSTNNYTYTNSQNELFVNQHKVGTVWASMLWDITWEFINLYGFDADFLNPNSGNHKVLQLVVNAMKIQPCNPSFITARNAIFTADELLYNGAHHCLLWESFAKRGLGLNASAGFNELPEDLLDQVEDFTSPDSCDKISNLLPQNPKVQIYPNPTSDNVIVNINKYSAPITITIFDNNGRLIYEEDVKNFSERARIKINYFATGIYFLKLKGKNVDYTSKIIKK